MKRSQLAALALAVTALALPASALGAAPTVTTGPATGVTYSGATLTGSVNPHGSETDYYFQYGTKTPYTTQTPLVPVGAGTKAVAASAAISGLSADTTYHYRLVAVGANTQHGADRTFVTPKVPLTVQITASPNPVLFGNPFVLNGTLSGTGNGNREIVLQAKPYPYTGPFANIGNPEVTHADGSFSFTFAGLLQNAQLQVTTTTKPPVVSPVYTENVAVAVSLHVKRANRRGGFVRLAGTVTPPEVPALVVFQRVTRKGVQNVGRTVISSAHGTSSPFSKVVRVHHHSLYRAVVTLNAGAPLVSNSSLPVLIR